MTRLQRESFLTWSTRWRWASGCWDPAAPSTAAPGSPSRRAGPAGDALLRGHAPPQHPLSRSVLGRYEFPQSHESTRFVGDEERGKPVKREIHRVKPNPANPGSACAQRPQTQKFLASCLLRGQRGAQNRDVHIHYLYISFLLSLSLPLTFHFLAFPFLPFPFPLK